MIENLEALHRGRDFERRVFGDWISDSDIFYDTRGLPEELNFEQSIQAQILLNWRRAELSREVGQHFYNPQNPETGESGRVFAAVRKYLLSQNYNPSLLHFYVAVGWNSLDFWHSIDAFFYWEGAIVTVDVSTERKLDCKADILLTIRDLNRKHLPAFGRQVGRLLIERRRGIDGKSNL